MLSQGPARRVWIPRRSELIRQNDIADEKLRKQRHPDQRLRRNGTK